MIPRSIIDRVLTTVYQLKLCASRLSFVCTAMIRASIGSLPPLFALLEQNLFACLVPLSSPP